MYMSRIACCPRGSGRRREPTRPNHRASDRVLKHVVELVRAPLLEALSRGVEVGACESCKLVTVGRRRAGGACLSRIEIRDRADTAHETHGRNAVRQCVSARGGVRSATRDAEHGEAVEIERVCEEFDVARPVEDSAIGLLIRAPKPGRSTRISRACAARG